MTTDERGCNEVGLMEYTTMKAAYELMNKKYRRNHRDMEKGVAALNKSLDELETVSDVRQAVDIIGKVMDAVRGSKRKAALVFSEESKLVQSCKKRLEHLRQISAIEGKTVYPDWRAATSTSDDILAAHNHPGGVSLPVTSPDRDVDPKGVSVTNPHYQEQQPNLSAAEQAVCLTRFQRLLADHLFASGQYRAAIDFVKLVPEARELCLTEIYEEALMIETSLMCGDTEPAHAWLQEANFKLKRQESFFEFDLRLFEFYLLVREGRRMDAIQHARKYMSSVKQPDDYRATKLGQAMILLAMRTPEELQAKAEENELTEKWIVKRAHQVLLEFYAFDSPTPFPLAIKAGISVIKTHYCYSPKTRHPDCVVCHPLINQLAENLPFGRHDHSVLTCYQTGLLMNDDNPPMSLPNGYVYSQKGLAELTRSDGTLTCPRSGEVFHASQAQRVYIV